MHLLFVGTFRNYMEQKTSNSCCICQFSLTLAAVYLSGSKNPYKMTHQCEEREENTVQAILRAHLNKIYFYNNFQIK